MKISPKPRTELDVPFKWLDQYGVYHDPKDMSTGHLWFTLRMIWNHSMPLKFEPYQRYDFAGLYTDDYMEQAVRHIVKVLVDRVDMEPAWQQNMRKMIDYLAKDHLPDQDIKDKTCIAKQK